MSTFWQDIRYAVRMMLKNPGFTCIAVLTLAIGIGANAAIFSVVNAVLLRPLPFRDPGSLCLITEKLPTIPTVGPSYQNLVDWRALNKSFEAIGAARNTTLTLTGAGEPERLQAQMASASLFPLLGVSAIQGHTFIPSEDRAGGAPVALLSYGMWQRRYGGQRDTLGKSITLDNQVYTIVGILPGDYQLIQPADIVIPFEPWAKQLPDDRSWHPGIIAIGRLKQGVALESAQAEMSAIAMQLEKQYPNFNTGVGAGVTRLREQLVQQVRPALLILLGAVALVLLIACANVANLLLARALSRRREIALRTAMGAGGVRILRQLLTESILLALLGGIAGLELADAAMQPLVALAANALPNVGPVQVDRPVLAFVALVAVFAGILFGIAPALQTMKVDLRSVLNEAGRGSTAGSGQKKMLASLVAGEIALALMLLVGAGLLLRSFERLQDVRPGFTPGNLLIADLPLSPRAYSKSADRLSFFDRVLERARHLSGVEAAGAAATLPVSGSGSIIHFNIEGRAPKTAHDYVMAGYRPVSPHYLNTLGVKLLKGRFLADTDTETRPSAVVVNQAMERQFFAGDSALGKRIQLGTVPDAQVPWMEIVGVVGDMKQSLAMGAQAEMYVPYRQADSLLPVFTLSIVMRTAGDPRSQIAALRDAVRELDRNQPLVRIRTMEENISASVGAPRFRTVLLGIFAASALVLAVIGLYGLMAYSVTQRMQEIGIRVTLGAQRGDVMRMVIVQGLKLALAGTAAGLLGSIILSRLLTTFLYGVSAVDPVTYAAVAALLISAALLACYIPARRATRVDPMVALRYE